MCNDNLITGIYATVTVREVANWYYRTPQTVRENIYRGKLIARQTEAGEWLISLESVRQLWGDPQEQHASLHNHSRERGKTTLWEQLDMFPEL